MAGPQQPYDSSLKALVREQAAEILPCFLPGVVFERELNVEIIRPTMRADKVFQVLYRGEQHILHIEFESSSDGNMAARLLTYHAVIYHDHGLPVISMIVYPFKVSMAVSPLCVKSGPEDILIFHFHMLPLYEMNAHQYVQQHIVAMYALLPTMQGADEDLLLQAIEEMATCYEDDAAKLARQLVWMGILLRRSDTVPVDVKPTVQRRLKMYDRLWDEDPEIQQLKTDNEAKGIRKTILIIVSKRFPGLLEQAQKQVSQLHDVDELYQLFERLSDARDEAMARWLLSKPAA